MIKNSDELFLWLKEHTNIVVESQYNVGFNGEIDYIDDEFLEFKNMDGIKKLPIKFNQCNSGLEINAKDLETLEGLPNFVNGFISIKNTKIINYEGFPKEFIGYLFLINNSKVETLTGLKIPPKTHIDDYDPDLINNNKFFILNNGFKIKRKYYDLASEDFSNSSFTKEYPGLLEIKYDKWQDFFNEYEVDLKKIDDYLDNFDDLEMNIGDLN